MAETNSKPLGFSEAGFVFLATLGFRISEVGKNLSEFLWKISGPFTLSLSRKWQLQTPACFASSRSCLLQKTRKNVLFNYILTHQLSKTMRTSFYRIKQYNQDQEKSKEIVIINLYDQAIKRNTKIIKLAYLSSLFHLLNSAGSLGNL